MKKLTAVAALLAITFGALLALTGCHSDPHDTHVVTGVTPAR